MRVLGFHHVAVQVKDVERVSAFYARTLGLPELKRFHRDDGSLRSVWLGVETAPATPAPFLAVEQLDDASRGASGFSMVALRIDPAERSAVVKRLEALKVPLEKQTGWTLYFRDPEGNLVGLSHHPHDAPAGER